MQAETLPTKHATVRRRGVQLATIAENRATSVVSARHRRKKSHATAVANPGTSRVIACRSQVLVLDLQAEADKSAIDVARSDTSPVIAPWAQAPVRADTVAASSSSLVVTAVAVAVKHATRVVALGTCHATALKGRSATTVGYECVQQVTNC